MASYGIHEPFRGQLATDAFLRQHSASMALSAPSGISISLPTNEYPHGHYNQSSSYFTPRTLAPHPGLLQGFTVQDYHQGEGYAVSSNSTSARGRSGSGASTVSVGYCTESPSTTPTSLHLLNGAGSQYQTALAEGAILTEAYTSPSQPQLSPCEVKQEFMAAQRNDSSGSVKTITDDRVFCKYKQCQDEKGQPIKFFSRKADVNRHIKSQHEVEYQDCPRPRCERKGIQGFTRRDHLTEHLRGFHMEDHPKRKKRGGNEDSKMPTVSAEDLTPTDVDVPTSHSHGSGFNAQADPGFKQEAHSSPEAELEDEFPPVGECRPRKNRGAKRVKPKLKVESRRHHPYARNQSKSHSKSASAEVKYQDMSPHASVSPEFATSRMMDHSTEYADHQAMVGTYTTDHMMSTIYTTHQDLDSFYIASMGQAYHGLPAPHLLPYQGTHSHDFHFQALHD